ncbi:hypothetical protein GQ53DRAFT_683090 [Thozetella sp. PMI_491]|nr:hypothetical protein GQ53DRAFT_683090 [Thozetella sp. PMI_491]
MQLTTVFSVLLSLAATAVAVGPASTPANNANRPIPTGACCVANTSLRQDVCKVNGATGRCVPANSAGCGAQLTCVADTKLSCDPTQQDRGREKCVAA